MPSPRRPDRLTSLIRLAALACICLPAAAVRPQPAETDLRGDALRALREGDFDKANALLARAATTSADAQTRQYASWMAEYEGRRQVLVADRKKAFDKALSDVKKLVAAHSDEVAAEFAAFRVFIYAEDKQRFTDSELARGIIERAAKLAGDHEAEGNWIRAERLYSNLATLEPLEPRWKARRKVVERRFRMTAMYCPDIIRQQRADDARLAEQIEQILPALDEAGDSPTTRAAATRIAAAATKPTTRAEVFDDSAFRIDWKDAVKGVNPRDLFQALAMIRTGYWRDVPFATIMRGGFEGVRTLITTRGIDQTFPALKDEAARAAFIDKLNALEAGISQFTPEMELFRGSELYRGLMEANRSTINLPLEVLIFEFGDAALAECDPFTNMIWPADIEEFKKQTQGEFAGVGIQIENAEDGSLRVASPLEGSPAFRQGIKSGDVITHVDGKPIKGITSTQAVKVITGKRGTPVTLTIRSFDGTSRDYTLVRDTIHVASLKGFLRQRDNAWDYFLDAQNRIGYIRLTTFSTNSAAELERATAELQRQGARGMILDLRNNPGGLLTAAIDIVNRFLDHGLIVSTHPDRDTGQPPTATYAHPEPDGVRIPLVILINQYSASASEIVSGALKDQGRAVIVGERSFGKGSVQQLYNANPDNPAADPTEIKITTAHYYLPSGRCLHKDDDSRVWGVDPDVKVEMTPEQWYKAQKVRQDFDVLHVAGEAPDAAATRPASALADELLKADSQLGAAVLLLRLQLSGAQVAQGTPAPGVATDPR